jgi:hypothetical protein
MDIARLIALSPGGHPVGIGLGALFALLDLFHLPYGQILEPGLELEGLRLRLGRLCFSLQLLRPLASRGQVRCGLLQGLGISGQLPGVPLQGLPALAGWGKVHVT